MFFMDTVVSGMFDHDLHEISKLHMQSRDPIETKLLMYQYRWKEKVYKPFWFRQPAVILRVGFAGY